MSLSQTKAAIEKYGEKLINNSITNAELKDLLSTKTFTAAKGYNDPNKPITEKNHTQQQAINDFVLTIAPKLSPDTHHQLTNRLITECVDRGDNTFMRNSTLEKAFFAYELVHYPTLGQLHFCHDKIRGAFKPEDIGNLETVILKPIIDLYKSRAEEQVQRLTTLCQDYCQHLIKSHGALELKKFKKYILATQMLEAISNTKEEAPSRLFRFKQLLTTENKDLLKEHRSGIKFLEDILNVLTLGLYSKVTKGTFSFWKSHGEVLTDNIGNELDTAPCSVAQ